MIKTLMKLAAVAMAVAAPLAADGDSPGATTGFETPHFASAEDCRRCHDDLTDAAGSDVSLGHDWTMTPMANAARNPVWQAKVASELKRNPQLASVINQKCAKCHAPMAAVELAEAGLPVKILGKGGLVDPANPYHAAAMEGVSCTLCHQIEDTPELGSLAGFSGHFEVAPERVAYGPVPDPLVDPMYTRTGYWALHAPHTQDSAVCATCHNLKTPFVDGDGELASGAPETEFPEQTPYTEWEHSDFGPGRPGERSCQSCHMPETDGVRIANRPLTAQPVDDFSRHQFLGANTTLLDLVDRNREALGVSEGDYAAAAEATRGMLASAADLRITRAALDEGTLRLTLEITNRTGHKFPTSFPARRAWVHLRVSDADGRVLFESGRPRADGGIQGADGERKPARFEPHYRVITKADQVQIYEPVMGDTDAAVTQTLLRGAVYLKDNRLPPAGFHKAAVPGDVAVVGEALDDPDFDDGRDLLRYRIPVGTGGGTLRVEARLMYQTLSRPFLADLYRDRDLPEVARLEAMLGAGGSLAETVAAATRSVAR